MLVYDRDCGLCKWLLSWVLRWDRAARLRPLALQQAEADELLAELSREQRAASWHLISPAGRRASAGGAAAPLLRLLPGGGVLAALPARLPGVSERAYRWVAANRTALSRLVPAAAKRRAGEYVQRRERAFAAQPCPPSRA